MENTATVIESSTAATGNPAPMAGLSEVKVDMDLNNFAAEMEKRKQAILAQTSSNQEAQMQMQTNQTITPEPTQLLNQPEAVVTPSPAIPEKFKTPDGQIDQAKVEKSTLNAQQALEKFLALEKEMKRKQNEVLRAQQGYQPGIPVISQSPGIPENLAAPMSFEAQLNAELAANANNPGIVLAKLFNAAKEAAKAEALNEFGQKFQSLEERTFAHQRQSELSGLINNNPELLDPAVVENVHGILEAQPWLKNSPEPYRAAFQVYLGQQELAKRTGSQVVIPIPMARTVQAPPAPVQAVTRPQGVPIQIDTRSFNTVQESLKNLSMEQKKAIYQQIGLPKY